MRARKLAVSRADEGEGGDESEAREASFEEERFEPAHPSAELAPNAPFCLACGGPGGCCPEAEVARLDSPSRLTREALGRLERADAEHRAAARSLRGMVMREVALGRGSVEVPPPPKPPVPQPTLGPCLRCAELAPKPAPKKRARVTEGQGALPFVTDAAREEKPAR